MTSLLVVLSAFNLDVELLAPECLVDPSAAAPVTFTQKYTATLLLPVVLALAVLLAHAAAVGVKYARGRTKQLHRNLPLLISLLLVLLSFL